MENQESSKSLRCSFCSTRKGGLRGTVGHEHDIFRLEYYVRDFPLHDLIQVNPEFLSFASLWVGANHTRARLGSRTRKAFAQRDGLQNRQFLAGFQSESPWLSHFSDDVHHACPSYL